MSAQSDTLYATQGPGLPLDRTLEVTCDDRRYRMVLEPLEDVAPQALGLPLATAFRLPFQSLDLSWYEATSRQGPYDGHPEYAEDWTLDLGDGDPHQLLVAPFTGVVITRAHYFQSWAWVLRILGLTPDGELITWMGAHLASVDVKTGDIVHMGDVIGVIGSRGGRYAAQLHEQIALGDVPPPDAFAPQRLWYFTRPSTFYMCHGVDPGLLARLTGGGAPPQKGEP